MSHWGETPDGDGSGRTRVPVLQPMEDTIYHLPVMEITAFVERGWWTVYVKCQTQGPIHRGTKDRSYFAALAKALDTAMRDEGVTG